ncbi:MAG: sulfite exporter TauE/SafE family protein [Halorientalis sp.]
MFPPLALGPVPGEAVGLGVFAAVGFLGGAHCLGMCGPLVTTYADRLSGSADGNRSGRTPVGWRDVRQHLLFNLGRTVSYAAIGALMGALGALLFDAAAVAAVATPVRAVTGIVVGVLVVATGATYLVRGSVGHGVAVPGLSGLFSRVYALLTDRVDRWVRGPRIVGLGMVHGVLPCPLLYPAYLYALARGSPVEGAVALGVLGLGTVPTLFAYGTAFQSVSTGTRVALHRALGVAFLALGYIPLSMGLALLGVDVPRVPVPVYQPLG